ERLTAWFDRVVRNAAWVGFAATAPRRARWPCCRERCPRRARSLLEPIRPVDARHSYSGSFPRRMRTCSGACTSGKSRSRSSLAGCGQLPITFAYASIESAQPFESSSSLHVRAAPIGSSHARAAGGVSLLRTLDEPQAEQASYEKAERLGVHGATLRQQGGGQ